MGKAYDEKVELEQKEQQKLLMEVLNKQGGGFMNAKLKKGSTSYNISGFDVITNTEGKFLIKPYTIKETQDDNGVPEKTKNFLQTYSGDDLEALKRDLSSASKGDYERILEKPTL